MARVAKPKPVRDMAMCWTPETAPQEFEWLYNYCDRDVLTELEASSRIADLGPKEFSFWQLDQRVNMRGMRVDRKGILDCMEIVLQCRAKYNAELRTITNGVVDGFTKAADMKRWIAQFGIHLFDLDQEAVEEALARKDLPPAVRRVLTIRQVLSFGSVNKLFAFRSHICNDDRIRDQYVFYGAHTSLWNGRAVQPANLYKGAFSKPYQAERALQIIACGSLELVEVEFSPGSDWCANGFDPIKGKPQKPLDPLEVVASCLRSLIVATPGTRRMSADFTAIQAVVTAALAGEKWRLDVFRTHGKLYEMQAALLTGNTLEYYAEYKKREGKHHDDRQGFGKIPILSGDFGAWITGWKKFGADKLGDDRFIKSLIIKLRNSIPNIVEFWGGQTRDKFTPNCRRELFGLEGAVINAITHPGQCFSYRQVSYQMHEDTLYCSGPSGTLMRYHAPRLERSTRDHAEPWELEISYEGNNSNAAKGASGWQRMKLYGGVLTQNIVSHECREIQAEALLRLENAGYPIVMHTHDENVAEVPDGQGSLDEYISLVRHLPEWCREPDGTPWPIKVPDAWESHRYGKWEEWTPADNLMSAPL
jgi:DNA polymerase